MSVSINISEASKRKLRAKMSRLTFTNREGLVKAMYAAGLDMQNQAKTDSPVDTGRLRQSIRKESIDNGLGVKISTNVEYAIYQNNGTWKIPGKRFMEKGFYAGAQRLKRTLKIK